MKKKKCVHYHYVGDYGLETCRKDGLQNEKMDFDCKGCPDFRSHYSGLKKCPFCGGKAYLDLTYEFKDEWEVFCQKCHVSMKKRGIKKAVDAWNSRHLGSIFPLPPSPSESQNKS